MAVKAQEIARGEQIVARLCPAGLINGAQEIQRRPFRSRTVDDRCRFRCVIAMDNFKRCDAHLASPGFFNAKELTTMTFKSTKVEQADDKTGKITSDFAMLGVTNRSL